MPSMSQRMSWAGMYVDYVIWTNVVSAEVR